MVSELPVRPDGSPWPSHGGAEKFLKFISAKGIVFELPSNSLILIRKGSVKVDFLECKGEVALVTGGVIGGAVVQALAKLGGGH
ncbi:hypothetical protein ACXM0N_04180 [Peribacillus simplex]